MKFQGVAFALALLAGVSNAAALPEEASGAQETIDQSNTPMNSTFDSNTANFLPNFEVTTYRGKDCNRRNQGTTRVDQSSRACIMSSNALSYHLTPLTNDFHSYPTCKKVQVMLKKDFKCKGESYFTATQDTGKCFNFYGPANHDSFYVKCVGT